MGLRHNFSASTDALNYDDRYWKLYADSTRPRWRRSEHKLSEFAYASVMDYGARFNSDVEGLGKYDTAAIRFGYGELIDLIPQRQAERLDRPRERHHLQRLHEAARDAGRRSATDTLDDGHGRDDGGLVQRRDRQPVQPTTAQLASRERPYKFCSDEFEGNFDCKTWDRGANQQEIVGNTDGPVPQLLRVQRLQAGADHLADRRAT